MKKKKVEEYIRENYPDFLIAHVKDYVKINKIQDFLQPREKEQESEEKLERKYTAIEKMIKSEGFSYIEDWMDKQMYSCILQILEIKEYKEEKTKFIQLQSKYETYQEFKRYLLITMRKLEEIRKKKQADNSK